MGAIAGEGALAAYGSTRKVGSAAVEGSERMWRRAIAGEEVEGSDYRWSGAAGMGDVDGGRGQSQVEGRLHCLIRLARAAASVRRLHPPLSRWSRMLSSRFDSHRLYVFCLSS